MVRAQTLAKLDYLPGNTSGLPALPDKELLLGRGVFRPRN